MLMGALAIFTLVACMGLMIVKDIWKKQPGDPFYPVLHAAAALLGSAFVITVAIDDARLYPNVGLAVVIILLGIFMGVLRKRGKAVPLGLIAIHAGLAVVCYGLLAFLTLVPGASIY